MYQITSYINHIGDTLDDGHYTAHVKDDRDVWQYCDDSTINGQKPPNKSEQAYIIVLKKL